MSTPARPKVNTSSPGPGCGRTSASLVIALLRGNRRREPPGSRRTYDLTGVVSTICKDKGSCRSQTPKGIPARRLQLTLEELGATQPEGPVRPLVSGHADDQVLRSQAALGVEPGGQLGVCRLLLLHAAALLEDLDHEDALAALDPQPRVLGDDVADRVLADGLGAVPRWRREDVEPHLLNAVGD